MAKAKAATKNTTLLRLKNTPFSNAKQLKEAEARIKAEEWEAMERVRIRKAYFSKNEYRGIIAPLLNGFHANVVGNDEMSSVVKVYLTIEDQVHVEVAKNAKRTEESIALEILVRSLTDSFMNGYFTALGLREDDFAGGVRLGK